MNLCLTTACRKLLAPAITSRARTVIRMPHSTSVLALNQVIKSLSINAWKAHMPILMHICLSDFRLVPNVAIERGLYIQIYTYKKTIQYTNEHI